MSDYHGEAWNPATTINSLLLSVRHAMIEDNIGIGSIKTSDVNRRACAQASESWNASNLTFRATFPHKFAEHERDEVIDDDGGGGESARRGGSVVPVQPHNVKSSAHNTNENDTDNNNENDNDNNNDDDNDGVDDARHGHTSASAKSIDDTSKNFDRKHIEQMSVAELKAIISQAGLSFCDCIEKSDLRERATTALALGVKINEHQHHHQHNHHIYDTQHTTNIAHVNNISTHESTQKGDTHNGDTHVHDTHVHDTHGEIAHTHVNVAAHGDDGGLHVAAHLTSSRRRRRHHPIAPLTAAVVTQVFAIASHNNTNNNNTNNNNNNTNNNNNNNTNSVDQLAVITKAHPLAVHVARESDVITLLVHASFSYSIKTIVFLIERGATIEHHTAAPELSGRYIDRLHGKEALVVKLAQLAATLSTSPTPPTTEDDRARLHLIRHIHNALYSNVVLAVDDVVWPPRPTQNEIIDVRRILADMELCDIDGKIERFRVLMDLCLMMHQQKRFIDENGIRMAVQFVANTDGWYTSVKGKSKH